MCRRPLFSMQWPCGPSNSSDILQLNLHWPPWTTTCWPPPPPWSSPCLLVNDLIHHQIHDHLQHNCLIFKFKNNLKKNQQLILGVAIVRRYGVTYVTKKEGANVRLEYVTTPFIQENTTFNHHHHHQWWDFVTDRFPPSSSRTKSHHGGNLSWWECAGEPSPSSPSSPSPKPSPSPSPSLSPSTSTSTSKS